MPETGCSGLNSTDRRGQRQDARATDGVSVCPYSLFPKSPNLPELEQHSGRDTCCSPAPAAGVQLITKQVLCPSLSQGESHSKCGFLAQQNSSPTEGRLEVWPGGEVRLYDPLPPAVGPPALPPFFFQLGGVRRPAPTLEPGFDHPQQCPSLPVYHMSELSGLVTSHPQLGGAEGPAECERCLSIRC